MKDIALASLEDAQALLDLQKLAYQSEARLYNDFTIPPLTQTIEDMKSDFSRKVFLKIEAGNQIVGSVRAYQVEETCHIERLIVHPDYQGQGFGSALMNHIEIHFGGARRFELFTGDKSERNIRLYQRLEYNVFKSQTITVSLVFVFLEKWNQRPSQ